MIDRSRNADADGLNLWVLRDQPADQLINPCIIQRQMLLAPFGYSFTGQIGYRVIHGMCMQPRLDDNTGNIGKIHIILIHLRRPPTLRFLDLQLYRFARPR
ncbi:hypothetical protein D3C80_1914410 [compost metagenome]